MGLFNWLGFGRPRDEHRREDRKARFPEVTDRIRDSGQTFFFGTVSSGERVDEKSAMQVRRRCRITRRTSRQSESMEVRNSSSFFSSGSRQPGEHRVRNTSHLYVL